MSENAEKRASDAPFESDQRTGPQPNPPEQNGRFGPGLLRTVASLAQIALLLPVATVIGWAIGLGLDDWLGQHWLYIAGIIFGAAAGFVQIFRTVRSLMKE